MAKKSAKSKGYRKSHKQQEGYSKKDLIIALIIVVGLILAFVLFNLLYDDGSLKVKDGVAQTEGVNSLIVDESVTATPHYFKIGQLADVEGYTLTSAPLGADANIKYYIYLPEDPAALIDQVVIDAGSYTAQEYIDYLHSGYADMPGIECADPQTITVNDHEVIYMTYHAVDAPVEEPAEAPAEDTAAEAPAEEPAEEPAEDTAAEAPAEDAVSTDYVQAVTACVSMGKRCVVMTMLNDTETQAEYVSADEMVEAMHLFLNALSYETR